MSDTTYTPGELLRLRKAAALNQTDMANRMGISFRAYQALEGGQNPTKNSHMMLARYALIQMALERGSISWMPIELRVEIEALSALPKA